jgi:NagD protein
MYFIDVQGTIIDDINKMPINGAIEFIDNLNNKNIPYMIITNNTKKASQNFLEYLNSIGFNIPKDKYLDPLMILKDIVKEKNIMAFGHDEFIEVLQNDLGYIIDNKNPKSLIVAISEKYNNDDYAKMIEYLINGANLVGMHQTTIYAKNNKKYPGVGAILEMLKFATSKDYEVVGKPSIPFYQKAFEKIGAKDYNEITIISDDVKGDLVGAKELGMKTVFVLSGKYQKEEQIIPFLKENEKPDYIFENMSKISINLE